MKTENGVLLMATYTSPAVAASSVDLATFKAWGRVLSDALASFGDYWEQTSDTGQVDWNTLASTPTAPNTVYQVWRMTDSLASSSPVYVRFDWRPYSGSTTGVYMSVAIGTGSNGSGTLTGNVATTQICLSYNANAAGSVPWLISAGDGWLVFYAFSTHGTASVPGYAIIERSRSSAGALTEDYTTLVSGFSSGIRKAQTIFKPGGSVTVSAQLSELPVVQLDLDTGALGDSCFVSPLFPIVGKIDNPMVTVISCKANDVLEGITFGVTLYGTSRTYKPTKAGYASQYFGQGTNNCFCLLWE